MDIIDLRKQIDEIDNKLTQIFIERMALSREIAFAKKQNNLPIENCSREKEIIDEEVLKMPEDIRSFGNKFYNSIFLISREYQLQIINKDKNNK